MTPSSQRVVMLQQFGGPECLVVVDQPTPEPGHGEVLVKELAASVQFTDVMLRKGQYPDNKRKPPLVLGYDMVGEVVKLGPGVTAVKLGQHVADLTMTGSYAQYRTVAADTLTVVDPSVDPVEATALILSWVTAYQLLHREADAKPLQTVLVLGASGAVGQALVTLAKLQGCAVWGAARTRHAELVRGLGAQFVDTGTSDFRQLRPKGFDLVLDGIGEDGFSRSWQAVGPGGRLCAYGVSSAVRANTVVRVGWWFTKLWWWNHFAGTRKATFFSVTETRKEHPAWFEEDLQVLLGMLARGEVKPRVDERIALQGVANAQARIEQGGLEGKIVLVPNGPRSGNAFD
jgi:NADPH:quinone reductase